MDIRRTGDNVGREAAAAFDLVSDAEAALQALMNSDLDQEQIDRIGVGTLTVGIASGAIGHGGATAGVANRQQEDVD